MVVGGVLLPDIGTDLRDGFPEAQPHGHVGRREMRQDTHAADDLSAVVEDEIAALRKARRLFPSDPDLHHGAVQEVFRPLHAPGRHDPHGQDFIDLHFFSLNATGGCMSPCAMNL